MEEIEWYDAPTSDEEVLEKAQHLQSQLGIGKAPYYEQQPRGWSTWKPLTKVLWAVALPFAVLWALVVGLLALFCAMSLIFAPFSLVLVPLAGAPLGSMIAYALGAK